MDHTAPEFLCIGAAHWDLVARAAAPPVPGCDLPGTVSRRPGGVALNLARGLAAAGRAVGLMAAIGRDPEGEALVALLAAEGVDTGLLIRSASTDRYLAIEGPDGALFAGIADCCALERAAFRPPTGPARPVLDGNLPGAVLATLADRPGRVVVAASPAKAAALRVHLAGATLICNRAEAGAILGAAPPDAAAAAQALAGIALRALVTDGARPAALAMPEGLVTALPDTMPGQETGAGDALAAGFLAAEAAGASPAAALSAALAAAARHRRAA